MAEKLNVGVMGTGHLGSLHAKMFSSMEIANLTGIYDVSAERAAQVAGEYGCKACTTPQELFDVCDAVSIATPTTNHFETATLCLNSGKDVFIEKPITSDISEAEQLVVLAAKNNKILQVGHIERFNPALLSLEKYLLNPLFIQTDRLAQFNPRGTDVNVVLDLMIHDIDIILSLVKSPVVKVDASGVGVVSELIDIANARIEFENGAVANVTASRISQKKMRKMRIFQKDNYISLDFTTGNSEVFRITDADEKIATGYISFGEIGAGEKKKKVIYEQPEAREVNALKYELELFVRSVQTRTRPVVSGEDGLRALQVAALINEKIKESLNKIRKSG
ncbi:MAG: Gfo/Idh/MocA family oxidoreductase [Ignavibacteriaceae bacterium]|nr:Gfo/Idh/MocA family oxidoreductase [Ignavibacteriaceae bacterium]